MRKWRETLSKCQAVSAGQIALVDKGFQEVIECLHSGSKLIILSREFRVGQEPARVSEAGGVGSKC